MIVFRVDTRCGLGHLMRMKWLALALQQQGQCCHFLLDSTELPATFWQDFPAQVHWAPATASLDANGNTNTGAVVDEVADASWCVATLASLITVADPLLWLVVDGYQFGSEWEGVIKQAGHRLAAVDDLARAHLADLVIDAKWQGANTQHRYLQQAPQAKHLLGPAYAILAPQYRHLAAEMGELDADTAASKAALHQYEAESGIAAPTQLMFSLGGGGDWRFMTAVLKVLCQHDVNTPLRLVVILGPYARETAELIKLSQTYPQVTLVQAPPSLAPWYRQSQLFVGALGTSLYELAATQTPALTFALAENQQNQLSDLAAFGHYSHLESLSDVTPEEFAGLIQVCLAHLPRLEKLRRAATVLVDGAGAKRIAAALLNPALLKSTSFDQALLAQANPAGQAIAAPARLSGEVFPLTSTLELRAVDDTDINTYLSARNRADNSWRMTITSHIRQIDHYRWWFGQTRQSYALEQQGQVLLYVWHQLHRFNGQHYWVGGWFAASDDVNFSHAQLILEWQLAHTAKVQPNAIWLAVIHKDNRFVSLLNQRAGFVPLQVDSDAWQATKRFFPLAAQTDFHFVGKFPAQE